MDLKKIDMHCNFPRSHEQMKEIDPISNKIIINPTEHYFIKAPEMFSLDVSPGTSGSYELVVFELP